MQGWQAYACCFSADILEVGLLSSDGIVRSVHRQPWISVIVGQRNGCRKVLAAALSLPAINPNLRPEATAA